METLSMVAVWSNALKQISEKEGLKLGLCRAEKLKANEPGACYEQIMYSDYYKQLKQELGDCMTKRYKIYNRLQVMLEVDKDLTSEFRQMLHETYFQPNLKTGLDATKFLWQGYPYGQPNSK